MDKELDIASIHTTATGCSSVTIDGKMITFPPVDFMSKLKCHGCGESKQSPSELKKCAGCGVAIYCSRECQKQAWSKHKFFCTGSSSTQMIKNALTDELIRFEKSTTLPTCTPRCIDSPLAGIASFQRYLHMHAWSFDTFCQVNLHLSRRGRGAEFFRHMPLAMSVEFMPAPLSPTSSRPGPRSRRNRAQAQSEKIPADNTKPWTGWKVRSFSYRPLAEQVKDDPAFGQMWADQQVELEPEVAALRAEQGERFLGMVPVTILVHSTFMISYASVPVIALRDPDALQDADARRALEDLQTLCVGCMNIGIPLLPFGTCKQVAIPGRAVWDKATREWWCKPEGTRERPFDDRVLEAFKHSPRKSQLHPIELMLLFADLTCGIATNSKRRLL